MLFGVQPNNEALFNELGKDGRREPQAELTLAVCNDIYLCHDDRNTFGNRVVGALPLQFIYIDLNS